MTYGTSVACSYNTALDRLQEASTSEACSPAGEFRVRNSCLFAHELIKAYDWALAEYSERPASRRPSWVRRTPDGDVGRSKPTASAVFRQSPLLCLQSWHVRRIALGTSQNLFIKTYLFP